MRCCYFLMVCLLVPPVIANDNEPGHVLFAEKFDERLDESWRWLREDRNAWRVREGALEIRAQPGDANTVKNALVRDVPDRSGGKPYAIEVELTNMSPPTEQWEQLGLTWYHDGKPVFKFVKERIDGQTYIFPGKVPLKEKRVQVRLIVEGRKVIGQYRTDEETQYKTAAEAELPPPGGKDEISLQTYHGPTGAEHWMRFDDFRIVEVDSD
jgi:hypothetical protein